MICIHGLIDINCPTCRMSAHTYPNMQIHDTRDKKNDLANLLFRPLNIEGEKRATLQEKMPKNNRLQKFRELTPISKAPFINQLPNFKNIMFSKRMQEIRINNPDKYKVAKKILLESPQWKFNEKDKK
ncbi:MAG: hypothetical protein BAJALOKI1v1_380019 [Promethearchaeota archaeon]|nr:MAG: hypothetical protein BAJALOKI1v1_380019 [Candidatus Lokiarchaeota archaeon]